MKFDLDRLAADAAAAQAREGEPLVVVLPVEPGETEWMTVVAVLSCLAHTLDRFRIVTACAGAKINGLRPEVRAFLDATTDLLIIDDPLAADDPRMVGIAAGAHDHPESRFVYVQPQTLFHKDCRLADAMAPGAVSGVPGADRAWPGGRGADADEAWRALYARFGLTTPAVFFGAQANSLDWPLFDRDFIASCDGDFPAMWLSTVRDLARTPDGPTPDVVDQVAASLAAGRAGMALGQVSPWWIGLSGPMRAGEYKRRLIRYPSAEMLRLVGWGPMLNALVANRSDFGGFDEFLKVFGPRRAAPSRLFHKLRAVGALMARTARLRLQR